MSTYLDERALLIKAINKLSNQDCQKLSAFLAGLEAGKAVRNKDEKKAKNNSDSYTRRNIVNKNK
jgi:hypothetical protein